MQRLYFLCTGNACRSQMAEGYARQYFDPTRFEIRSAGIERHGVNPWAIRVMAEDGVDIQGQTSKVIDPTYLQQADLVITLCGDARDRCPALAPKTVHRHWPLPDPAQVQGTEAEILAAFRQSRAAIKARIQALAQQMD